MDIRQRRRLGGTGLLFVALFVVSIAFAPSQDPHWSGAKAVSYATAHKTGLLVSCYVIVMAVAVGLVFYRQLRDLLAADPASRTLAGMGFAGIILFAASGGLSAALNFAIADVANHASADTVQTLNVMATDMGAVMGAGGVGVFLLTTSIVVLRSGVLARWLGWVAAVGGVAALGLPFMSGGFVALWTLLAGITLLAQRPSVTVGSGHRMDPMPVT